MEYKKNTEVLTNRENIVFSIIAEDDNRRISAIAHKDGNKVASIVSEVHGLDALKGEKCYEVLSVESANCPDTGTRLDIMFRLQKLFYVRLHDAGIRYFWFESRNRHLIKFADMLFALCRVENSNVYYADLNRMFYHEKELSLILP